MSTLTDDFNRANGGLGASWQVISGGIAISGSRVACASGEGIALHTQSAAGNQTASIDVDPQWSAGLGVDLILKANDAMTSYFRIGVGTAYGTRSIQITKVAGGTSNLIGGASIPIVWSPPFRIEASYTDGVLVASAAGVTCSPVSDASLAGNARAGLFVWRGDGYGDNYSFSGTTGATMTVSPDPLWVGGGSQLMTATGTGTAWTAGVPGSSTITADHGSISEQYTIDATTIRFTYAPAEWVGAITFTESQDGLTDTINATVTPQEGQGTAACPFNPEFVDLANQTGIDSLHRKLTTTSDVVVFEPNMGYQAALSYLITLVRNLYPGGAPWPPDGITPDPRLDLIWDAINGGVAQPNGIYSPASDQPVKLDTEQALAALGVLTHDGDYNLATVISQLAGSEGYDLTTLLANIPSADNQPVLDALAAIRGDTTTSLYTLLSSLAGIRTIDALSLRDVLQAIDLLPKTMDGGYTTADRLANAGGFAGVLLAIGALATVEAEDAASSSGSLAGIIALATELAGGIASILGVLESLRSLLGGGANEYRAPVWPGAAHVTYGEFYDLATVTHIPGPMHGVELNITATEPKTLFYDYDGHTAWRHIGGLVFYNDLGNHETYQALGFAQALYVPKTLAVAQGCRLFKNRLPKGTVRPWTINT